MGRLNTVNPNEASGRVKEILDGPLSQVKDKNIFKAMANSPVGLEAYLGLGGALKQGNLSGKEREVIALALGEANGCDYCTAAHTAIGQGEGLSEDQTVAARKGDSLGDEKLDALRTFAIAVNEKKGFVSDQDIKDFKDAGYTDAEVVEVVANVAMNMYTNMFNHVNETEVDFPKVPAIA
jgi:uncharacterized peroxidase-related enzyme